MAASAFIAGSAAAEIPALNLAKLEPSHVSKEFCEDNAYTLGYLTVMNDSCGYKMAKQPSAQVNGVNKVCIKKLGEDQVSNTVLSAIHDAKDDLKKYEHSDVCKGIYKAYKKFYN